MDPRGKAGPPLVNTGVDAHGDQSGSVLDFNAEGVIISHMLFWGLQNCIGTYACPHKGPNIFHAGRRDAHRLACECAWSLGNVAGWIQFRAFDMKL